MPAGLAPVPPLGKRMPVYPGRVFSAPWGTMAERLLLPSTKGCFPSWQERKVESSGGAFQRVLHQGWSQPRCWSRKRAGSMSGQTPQLLSAHPIPAGSSKPWAQALEAPALLPPFQKVSVLLSTVWGAVQNRQRAQLDTALLNTKGINNPAGDKSSFSPRMPRAQIAFL